MASSRQKSPTVAGGEGETWYARTSAEAPARAPLTVDVDTDVCVIGGGLAGLTSALELARRGWSVVLLESHRIAGSASGRNTGIVAPGFALRVEDIIERVGLEHAQEIWKLSAQGMDYVRQTINRDNLPDCEPVAGWLDVSQTDEVDTIRWRADLLHKVFGAAVETWPTDRLRESLHTSRYFQALHFSQAFHIQPLNYARGLASAAETAGARIYEDTPALALDLEGIRKRIVTPSGRVRAEHVVLAGGAHLGDVIPALAGTIVPVWSYTVVTERMGSALREAIDFRGGISDSHLADNHYRVIDGDRLVWSGRMTTWSANPRHFTGTLRADMQRTYPQLHDVSIASTWSGVVGRTVHQMPQIGEVQPGVWVAGGFGGQGINTTALAGNLIARAIAEGDDAWRLFLPFELIWAGGVLGSAAVQASYWYAHAQARFAGGRSRVLNLLVPVEPRRADPTAPEPAAPEPQPVAEPQPIAEPQAVAEPSVAEQQPAITSEQPPELPPVEQPVAENIEPGEGQPARPRRKRGKRRNRSSLASKRNPPTTRK